MRLNTSIQKRTVACLSGLAMIGLASVASAATLVDYKPGPTSSGIPEFLFNGPVGAPSFKAGPGATGNGDGVLPPQVQTPGGLDAEAAFIIPGVPGSTVNPVAGTTLFYDTTLVLNGFVANAPAQNLGGGAAGPFFQSLGNGSFNLFSTTNILLLSGNVTTASFIAGSNGAAGGGSGAEFNAGGVQYTGGLIFNALIAAGGDPTNNGMSISMTSVLPGFGIDPDGFLSDFTADATGLYNVNNVPEPTLVSLATLTGIGMLSRRRKA